ncbi:MAG: hypothetical protein LIO79_00205 [Rikenellaceae bacterium]|nr:hypothetical protein [Rikenellaceae bacterium]
MKNILKITIIFLLTVSLTACKDFFNPDGNDILQESDYIGSYSELFMGFLGVTETVQEVAEKAIYLEGLRGLSMEPTYNVTDQDFWDVYYYVDQTSGAFTANSLASPEGYYKVILNANDYLYHASKYYTENPRVVEEYEIQALIGATLRWKAWAYLQIAKIYGEGVYIDDPLLTLKDINQFPMWGFDELIAKCIDLINYGIDIEGVRYDGKADLDNWYAYLDPESDETVYRWERMVPKASMLLAELYLYAGDWQGCFNNCIEAINSSTDLLHYTLYSNSRVSGNHWIKIWNENQIRGDETMVALYYNYTWQQENNLKRYFNPNSPNLFWLRATEYSVEKFDEEPRGLSAYGTIRDYSDEYIINKWAGTNITGYEPYPYVILYRAVDMYLFMVEALVHMDRFEAALAVFNGYGDPFPQPNDPINNMYDWDLGAYAEFMEGLPSRMVDNGNGNYICMGIRGRGASSTDAGKWVLDSPNIIVDNDKRSLDSLFVEETFLESTAEARHYYAMMRIVRRWPELLPVFAEQVASKYEDTPYRDVIYGLLSSNVDNWFIKYKITDLE